jgi:amino acid transporter
MGHQELSREEQIRRDAEDLKRLGYGQQLFREMGGFSNFAISFTIISVLTGAILLYGYGLKFAGPIINSVGWPIVSLFTLCVAASMAELASTYPTAGGLYFWAFRLGGPKWAWLTAWFNMIGQVSATAGINIAASMYLIGAFTRILNLPPDVSIPIFGKLTNWYFQVFVMAVLTVPQILLNLYGIRLTALLNQFSVWWHIAGVLIIALLLSLFGKYHNDLAFLFSTTAAVNPLEASSAEINGQLVPALAFGNVSVSSPLFGLFPALADFYRAAPFALVFVLGMLQAQWTYTGYDASAHVAEETVMARQNSAWGVFLSVAISAVVGYVLLMAVTWCIPRGDVAAACKDAYPVLFIAYENLPSSLGHVIAIVIGGAMWLCGCASITSMSRMWYAFARDDGMPGSRFLKRVSTHYRIPVVATWVTSALTIVLCLYAAAFYVVTSISTITLYLAYMLPIYLNWRNKRRGQGEYTTPETSPWNLGRWGTTINVIAILWTLFITVVFSIPPNELVLWSMLLLALLLLLIWALHSRKHFRGPQVVEAPISTASL